MISIKKEKEIKILKEGGKRLAFILNELIKNTKEGITTLELEKIAIDLIKKQNGESAFLNYKPDGSRLAYPANICVSINEEIVHGVPSKDKIIKNGDVVSIDLGFKYKNLITDSAYTVGIGNVDARTKKLINTTKNALYDGIKRIKDGAHIGDIGFAVEKAAKNNGFSVFRELVGHGVGRELHEEPFIPNFGDKGSGEEIKKGMVLAIELMLGEGGGEIIQGRDGFVYKSRDGKRSAHFEHTVVVTKNGAEILT